MDIWLILTILVSCFVVYSISISIYRYVVIRTRRKGWSSSKVKRGINVQARRMFG